MKLNNVIRGRSRETITLSISIKKADRDFQQKHGISPSKLVRVAIQELREVKDG